ncbi:putative transcriptional regulator, AraC family [Rhodopseudomonas palustris]|uniref:helix-turn-helix domain-containing protein n=1 Tax=Rhodopseudomonas palustris TaxID=1076 RepID=UPI000D1A6F11|nr:helix-turn-helix domain-containing protein [Rhodopseudomonas palustris]AVT76741.1 putative transcriptional regulator, AraC family [Rhodopseudomonas palustris]
MPKTANSDRLLKPARFSTADLSSQDRFDAWREKLRDVADLEPNSAKSLTRPVELATWDLGAIAVCQEKNPGAKFKRDTQAVRRALADHWYLYLLKSGSNCTIAGDRKAAGNASERFGQIGFYSLGQACHGEMNDIETLMVFIPRDLFAKDAAAIDKLNNSILQSPLASLLSDYLLALERQLAHVKQDDAPGIAKATEAMLSACLVPGSRSLGEARDGVVMGLVERARRIVRAQLANPRLSPATLASGLGVSRSLLYRLFEPHGGVAAYIRNYRLGQACRALSDPNETRRIAQIALSVGFVSPQEFSRAFRAQYGCSPSDARADRIPLMAAGRAGGEGGRSLDIFLRMT